MRSTRAATTLRYSTTSVSVYIYNRVIYMVYLNYYGIKNAAERPQSECTVTDGCSFFCQTPTTAQDFYKFFLFLSSLNFRGK